MTFANSVVAGASTLQMHSRRESVGRTNGESETAEDGKERRVGGVERPGKIEELVGGWRLEFMAALSLYRPCRVSFSL